MASETKDSASSGDGLKSLMVVLWGGAIIALIATIGANLQTPTLVLIGVAVLIFLAAFATGAFFGFLFGAPQVLSGEERGGPDSAKSPIPTKSAEQAGGGKTTSGKLLKSNTSLEKISNWLTTLIVGASLTQISSIDLYLSRFRDFLSKYAVVHLADGSVTAGILPAVGPIILIFGAVSGFLFMYLNTRLVLVLLYAAIEGHLDGESLSGETKRALLNTARNAKELGDFRKSELLNKRKVTVEDSLNLMLDLLYKGSFDEVINIGANLSNSPATDRADYWFYLAAAFGQKMKTFQKNSPDWESNRDNAMDCAARAVSISTSYRDRLWSISDPKGLDDDLSQLRDYPPFRKLVGR